MKNTTRFLLYCLCWSLLACSGCNATDLSILESYINKDLRNAKPEELKPIQEILKTAEDEVPLGLAPWYVWKTHEAGQPRYIVLEAQRIFTIPGRSSARISLFDEHGKKISYWAFSTGWRIDIVDASFADSKELDTRAITIRTSPVIHGRDVAKQIFAFSSDALRFVRMEDSRTNLISNTYTYPNHTFGVSVEGVTEEEWIALLRSKKPVDVLSALVFLGGNHMDPGKPERDVSHEDIDQAKLFERLKTSKVVNELLQKHTQSTKNWVREAAELAQEQKE